MRRGVAALLLVGSLGVGSPAAAQTWGNQVSIVQIDVYETGVYVTVNANMGCNTTRGVLRNTASNYREIYAALLMAHALGKPIRPYLSVCNGDDSEIIRIQVE